VFTVGGRERRTRPLTLRDTAEYATCVPMTNKKEGWEVSFFDQVPALL
jgi:hypothetical protein